MNRLYSKKTGIMNVDLGAIVSLDHNYAQVFPIRGTLKDSGKETNSSNHTLWSLSTTHHTRRHRTKSYSSDKMSDPCESLEEEDLIEYYSQWCDKVFNSDYTPAASTVALGTKHNYNSNQNVSTSRVVTNDYTSDSTQRTSPSTTTSDSMNNLNLLANCGTEEQRSREGNIESASTSSRSPILVSRDYMHSGYESPKLENDYQVLAAANALLQLSGTDGHNPAQSQEVYNKLENSRKRKGFEIEDSTPTDRRNSGCSYATSALFKENSNIFSNVKKGEQIPKKYRNVDSKMAAIKKAYLAGMSKNKSAAGKKKKRKRKYKKNGKGTGDDDDSLDSEMYSSKITFTPNSVMAQRGDPWGQAIKYSVLVHIFKFVVKSDGCIPSLVRLSRVCRLWYTATKEPSLWNDVDLSGEKVKKNKRSLIWLCITRLSMVQKLNLANWELLTGKELQIISKNCPMLHTLSLSRCSKLNSSALRGLIENCTKLNSLDLSYTSTVITSRYLLEYLIEKRGSQLKSLNLATNILVKFDVVMPSIVNKCHLLEILDLSNVVFSNCLLPLHIEELQIGCPRIRVLLLTNSLFKAKKIDPDEEEIGSVGFVHLESLSIARSTVTRMSKFRYINNDVLNRFLKASTKLKNLDISGCRHVTNKGLQQLVAQNLQSLNISHCSLVNQSDIYITLSRWKHSLLNLDISGNTIEGEFLKSLAVNLPKLSSLSLMGCRGIPWSFRKDYHDEALQDLNQSLAKWDEWKNEPCLD